jgi:hypothetical protein
MLDNLPRIIGVKVGLNGRVENSAVEGRVAMALPLQKVTCLAGNESKTAKTGCNELLEFCSIYEE